MEACVEVLSKDVGEVTDALAHEPGGTTPIPTPPTTLLVGFGGEALVFPLLPSPESRMGISHRTWWPPAADVLRDLQVPDQQGGCPAFSKGDGDCVMGAFG